MTTLEEQQRLAAGLRKRIADWEEELATLGTVAREAELRKRMADWNFDKASGQYEQHRAKLFEAYDRLDELVARIEGVPNI